jgi:hypothetical protein
MLAFLPKSAPTAWKRICFCFAWIVLPLLPVHPVLLINADLRTSRVLYLSAAGMAMLLAQLLDGLYPVRLRSIVVAMLVCLYSAGALHNLAAWRWTTEREKDFLSELKRIQPTPPLNTEFIFHDMPTAMRGVCFLETGLRDAIRLTLRRDEVTAKRDGSSAGPPGDDLGRPLIHLQWTGTEGALITPLSK